MKMSVGLLLLMCGCISVQDNIGDENFSSYERCFDEKCYSSAFRAFGVICDRTNLCVSVVNNMREVAVVDLHNLRYCYIIQYRTHMGELSYTGNIAVSRCGPLEVAILKPLEYPSRQVMEMASTLDFEIELPNDCLGVDKVSLEVPFLQWRKFVKTENVNDLETAFWGNSKLIPVELKNHK